MAESTSTTNEIHADYSGGVNQSVSRLLMADNEINWAENVETEKIGSLHKVRGYSQRGETVNDGYNVLGLINGFKPSNGTKRQIAVVDGALTSDAYSFDPALGVWTANHLNLTTGAKAEFASFLDGFFMVNYSDATRFNNLTAWSTTTNVTAAAQAKYIKEYLSRIYLANVVSSGTSYHSRVTYSNLPSGNPLTITWDDNFNFFDVATDDGDEIMGLEVNANRLLIFKHDSLYRYDTNTLYQVPGCPGTVSQRSVRNIQGHTLYLHDSGIWDYDGSSATLISRKIQQIIDGMSTKSLSNASAWVKTDHYYLFVGNISNTRFGLSITNCLIDYDIAKQSFTWRSLKDKPLAWMTYPDDTTSITYDKSTIAYGDANTAYDGIQTTEERIFFGTDDGKVFQFDVGNQYNNTDISYSIETKDYYLGYPAYWKLLQKVYVFNDYAGKGLIVQAKFDDGDWVTLGLVNREQTLLYFPSGCLCQRVRFRIQESSGTAGFSFEGLDIYFTPIGLLR